MQNLIKSSLLIAALAVPMTPLFATQAMADKNGNNRGLALGHQVKSERGRGHQKHHSVGHRFNKSDVVIISNWRERGLPRPGRNEIYVVDRDDIYLATAATLVIKALMN